MSHTTLWRNRDYDLDLAPGLLHEEALTGARHGAERVPWSMRRRAARSPTASSPSGWAPSAAGCAPAVRGAATS